ncbi:MAG: TIGR01244 family sulfur transferase [Pseudomonadota bacterium]|nr:TIGR01244 family sulfur transferase [Pseudomonadota bacterium]
MAHELDRLTEVSAQIAPSEVAGLKARGVTMIVNNRPDDEDVAQPTSAEIETAAHEAGIDYRHVPITRGIGPADVEAMRNAIHEAGEGRLFAFCRSGNRSALAWAVAKSEDGTSRAELEQCVSRAGFDLGAVSHLLRD